LNILYIHQYFKTPSEGGAIRSYYIARGMIDAGHEVEMITSHNQNQYIKKDIEGITVHYLPVKYYNHFGFLRRMFAFLFFAYKAYHLAVKFENIDLAYVTSTPLTVALIALRLNRQKQIPYVFEIRDLWPEAPIRLLEIKNIFIKTISRKLEMTAYRKAHKIVSLSPGIHEHVSSLLPGKSVYLCPNFSDCTFFERTNQKNEALLEKHSIGNAFVISYFGAIGKVNALNYFLDLVKVSEDHKMNIRFFMIGEGAMLTGLRQQVKLRNLRTIEFLPHMDKFDLKEYLSICDAAYISFINNPVMRLNSPNKFFDALASGKLVITNTKGWVCDLIEKNKCGFYMDPEIPGEFASKIQPFLKEPHLNIQQVNARRLAEESFDKDKCIKNLMSFIDPKYPGFEA
jgi:glycosyltransferase involved in cell wall biosynthesis